MTYILVPIIFSSFTPLENDYLNPTVFALFAILASLFLYFQKEKDYYERKNIMEENKELYNLNSKLQKKSITDSLTSYYNRHFLESLSEKCNYNIKNNIPVGVLMIDIDNFKDFNDYYNHIEGDRALIKISETIKEVIAPYTIISSVMVVKKFWLYSSIFQKQKFERLRKTQDKPSIIWVSKSWTQTRSKCYH